MLPPTRSGITDASTTQPVNAEDAQFGVDHRHVVLPGAHLAGTERVMDADPGRPDMRVERLIRGVGGAGQDLPGDERAQRRLLSDLANEAQPGAQSRPIPIGGEEVLADADRNARVRRRQLDTAAALRPQHHRAAAETVGVGAGEWWQIGRRRLRGGGKQELHVGQLSGKRAFQKRHHAARQVGGEARAEEVGFGEINRDAVEPHLGMKRSRRIRAGQRQLEEMLVRLLAEAPPIRLPGTVVFLTAATSGIPLPLSHFLKHNHALHERVLLVNVQTSEVPLVPPKDRAEVRVITVGLSRVLLHYGFTEKPDVPAGLRLAIAQGKLDGINIENISYIVGRPSEQPSGMARWRSGVRLHPAQLGAQCGLLWRAGAAGRRD
jgi:hypothetical protein